MTVIHIFMLLLFLIFFPITIGLPWTRLLPKKNFSRILACFPIGLFVELAIFHLVVAPMGYLHLPFTLMCWIFVGIVVVYGIWSTWSVVKKPPFAVRFSYPGKWAIFYLTVFLVLVGIQMYRGFTRDTTVWSYDDAMYVTYAADTLRYNAIQMIDPYTGIAQAFDVRRALQTSLYYPAFLSMITSIPVTVMERTILETYNILLAYIVYAYMASVLYRKAEDGLIFLIILCFVHIYGWYSQYSVTFRLLGPNYQGKAVLAVSFFPLLFTLMIQMLAKRYSVKYGVLLLLLSASAGSLTMFGNATMVVNTVLVLGLSLFRRDRQWKYLRYIPWATVFPMIGLCIYFINKLPFF